MLENLHQVRGKNSCIFSFSANEGQYIHEERCLPFHSDASQVRLLSFPRFFRRIRERRGRSVSLNFKVASLGREKERKSFREEEKGKRRDVKRELAHLVPCALFRIDVLCSIGYCVP